VRVRGVEASAHWRLLSTDVVSVPLRLTYTLTRSEFRNSFQSHYGPWGTVQRGYELPYVPRHQGFAAVDVEALAWRVRIDATAVSRMRTAAGTGALMETRSTDVTFAIGGSAEYVLTPNARLFASVQNATNHAYVVARHPSGVRPGAPRRVMVGLNVELGR
jgi:Fe(3+) dicitrate transport protein